MKVLFVCDHNRGRSQMAAAFYNKFSDAGHADSAGTTVLTPGQTIEQRAEVSEGSKYLLATMDIEGIDIRQQTQKPISTDTVNNYDKIIVMAEEKSIPDYVKNSGKYEYWQVEDPQSKGPEKTDEVKNIIKQKVQNLIKLKG